METPQFIEIETSIIDVILLESWFSLYVEWIKENEIFCDDIDLMQEDLKSSVVINLM